MTHHAALGQGDGPAEGGQSTAHEALASRLAVAEAALAHEAGRTKALNRIAAAIGAAHSVKETAQIVVDGGAELCGAAWGAFYYTIVDPAGERLTQVAVAGVDGLPPGAHFDQPFGRLPVKSVLAVPVAAKSGQAPSGLFFGHPDAGVFSEWDEDVVTGLAAQAAVAMDNVRLVEASGRELEERRMAEQRQRLLLNELNHRVRNTLATVQSISSQTLRSCVSPQGFNTAFEARLTALSEAHNLLNAESWGAARLTDLIRVEIAPFDPAFTRLSIEGDGEVRIAANPAVALGMAIHELATNAARLGALSAADGCVTVRWRHVSAEEAKLAFGGVFSRAALFADRGIVRSGGHEEGEHLLIDWVESGGPRVTVPDYTGFGAKLLKRGLATQLSGVVDIAYDPEGLRCRMDIPLEALELS